MTFIIIVLLLISIGLQLANLGKIPLPFTGSKSKLILDSCALIDGRVLEIAKAGFLRDQLIIPQFILSELQFLADGNDSQKRDRARFGLDVAKELQDALPERVSIDRSLFPSLNTTDDKLIVLAKKLHAALYTTDYNLNKVAGVEGIMVLNVNELSQQLRPVTLPGELRQIKIIQKGSGQNQGVGYLEDGTMVVVENGAKYIGKTVPVVVDQMHQTVAGKMIFAKIKREQTSTVRADTKDTALTNRLARSGQRAQGKAKKKVGA